MLSCVTLTEWPLVSVTQLTDTHTHTHRQRDIPVAMRVATLRSAASMWSMSNACIFCAWRTDFILNRSEERHDRKFLKSLCSASYQWIQAARIRVDDWPRRIRVAWSSWQKSTKPYTHTYTYTRSRSLTSYDCTHTYTQRYAYRIIQIVKSSWR